MSTQFQSQLKPVSEPAKSFTPVQSGLVQRKCGCGGSAGVSGECGECQSNQLKLQRHSAHQGESAGVPPVVNEVLRSPGQGLEPSTRSYMESRFGHDFSHVRVHTDAQAMESARSVNALAYTAGQDVVFGAGQYQPQTEQGRRLIAHELTHTIQQGSGTQQQGSGTLRTSSPGDASEREADAVTEAVMEGKKITPTVSSGLQIARQGDGGTAPGADAGADAGPGADGGAPDAGPDAGGPPAAPGPAPAPAPGPAPAPAPSLAAPVVSDLTVVNQASAITFEEPGTGGPHFVTVAGQGGDENVIVEATTDRPLNPGETINWTIDPASRGAVDPGNPLRVLVPRRRSTHVHVTAESGGASRSLHVWAIFAQVRTVNGPTVGFSPPAAPPGGSACNGVDFCAFATVSFDAEVFPKSLTAPATTDRPNFARAPVAPPGGNNSCGVALVNGVNSRFDMSRQIECGVVDPAGHLAAICVFTPRAFPANNAEGNDDGGTVDEMNDPFAGGNIAMTGRAVAAGFIGADDPPSVRMPHAVGAVGDTFEINFKFKEFARLDYRNTWWLISNRQPWSVNLRAVKNAAGRWVDNGTTAG